MSKQVLSGATLKCDQGASPSILNVAKTPYDVDGTTMATIEDYKPNTNVPPFGMCKSPANPAVQANKGAPVPCTPIISAPWAPGASKVTLDGTAALSDDSTCKCQWAGTISIEANSEVEIE